MLHDTSTLGADYSACPAPTDAAEALADSGSLFAAGNDKARPTVFRAPKGVWFDEDYDFTGPEGDVFTAAVLAAIEAVEVRVRKRKQVDEPHHRLLVRKLAVNGYRAFHWFNPPLVALWLGPKAYSGRGGPWLNGDAIAREIGLLAAAGLIEINDGVWREASTTYSPTAAFVALAEQAKLSDRNVVHRLARERLIRVYRTNSDDGDLIDFELDDQTCDWVERCDTYNGFVATQDIGIDGLSKAEMVQLIRRQNACRQTGTPQLQRIDLTNKSVFRQFNNGGFEAGGRLYGAWWVNCPSALRPLITINGEPTVELDFSGCSIRMLYHRNGLAFDGDAYALEPLRACVEANGLRKRHFRPGTKRLAQALINTSEQGRPGAVRLNGDERVRPWFTEAEVLAMLRDRHAPIAHEFQSEAWTWLQREDSEIALTVISNLMEKGIVALPIHDSFVVVDEKDYELKDEMNKCYFDRFGFYPEIE